MKFTDPRTRLCPRHRAQFDKWSDFGGPEKPLPKGITGKFMHEQLADIKQWCAEGHGCGEDDK